MTFAAEKYSQRNRLSITKVVDVKELPAFSDIRSNDRDKSILPSSISEAERKNNRSYNKFNGKKKYQVVGGIKNTDNSQINMSAFDHDLEGNHKVEGGSIILTKPPL